VTPTDRLDGELLAQYLIARSPAREDRAHEPAAFLIRTQTKNVSARSFVQDSGARSWALGSAVVVVARRGRTPLLASPPFGGARYPTLAAGPPTMGA
jgi:hypothetical protein